MGRRPKPCSNLPFRFALFLSDVSAENENRVFRFEHRIAPDRFERRNGDLPRLKIHHRPHQAQKRLHAFHRDGGCDQPNRALKSAQKAPR